MERLELTVSRLRLPRAILRREPYFVALAVPQFGRATDVRTVPFPRVNRSHDLEFDPPFVLLSVPDPGSRVAISVAIMESDAGFRAAGARIDRALEKLQRGSVGHLLGKGSKVAGIGPAVQVATGLVAAVAKFLGQNGDDVLGVLELSIDVPLIENGIAGNLVSEIAPARRFATRKIELDYGISISRSSEVPPIEAALTTSEVLAKIERDHERIAGALADGLARQTERTIIAKGAQLASESRRETFAEFGERIFSATPPITPKVFDLSDDELERLTAPDAAPASTESQAAPVPAADRGLLGRILGK